MLACIIGTRSVYHPIALCDSWATAFARCGDLFSQSAPLTPTQLQYTYTISFGTLGKPPVATTVPEIIFTSNPVPSAITQGPLGATEILRYTAGINFTLPVSSVATTTMISVVAGPAGIGTTTESVPLYSVSTLASFTPTRVVIRDGLTA